MYIMYTTPTQYIKFLFCLSLFPYWPFLRFYSHYIAEEGSLSLVWHIYLVPCLYHQFMARWIAYSTEVLFIHLCYHNDYWFLLTNYTISVFYSIYAWWKFMLLSCRQYSKSRTLFYDFMKCYDISGTPHSNVVIIPVYCIL